MFAHLVLLLGLVYKPLTQLFWSQPKPPLMAHSASSPGLLVGGVLLPPGLLVGVAAQVGGVRLASRRYTRGVIMVDSWL